MIVGGAVALWVVLSFAAWAVCRAAALAERDSDGDAAPPPEVPTLLGDLTSAILPPSTDPTLPA